MSKTGSFGSGPTVWILLALAAITLVVFAPVRHYGFVSIDDPLYVSENPHVAQGLTRASVAWAFTARYAANWHPLTWLSHMLDVQLFGLAPGAHHVVNLLLHTLSVLLLFALLRVATGRLWAPAFVAALFAVHPLHVESVAWVAERKDVLSTVFSMLTLLAYVWYVRSGRTSAYLVVLLVYALGLMAKPMLVTLPLVLLLVDWWPLGRVTSGPPDVRRSGRRRLVLEKLPLFALAIISTVITFAVQQRGGAVSRVAVVPVVSRVANAITSYGTYVGKMFWPTGLSVFYRYPDTFSIAGVLAAAAFLSIVSVLVVRQARSRPYLAVGWFWYLVTLLPVIGLVQVGRQSMADRYTYVPLVGLFIMVAWGLPDLLRRRLVAEPSRDVAPPRRGWRARLALPFVEALVIAGCAVTAHAQVQHWSSSETLWRHALEVDPRNYFAHNSLGTLAMASGHLDEAAAHFARAVELAADYPEAHHNLGLAYARRGRTAEAIDQYREALALRPDLANTHDTLGMALIAQGNTRDAISQFEEAIRLQPELATAHSNLGKALASLGNVDAAIGEYSEALRLDPRLVDAHNNLGAALAVRGRASEAVVHYREALRLRPEQADVRSNLGVALAALGDSDNGIRECAAAVQSKPGAASLHYNLGVVLADHGRLSEAVPQFTEALRLQPDLAPAHTRLALALTQQGDLAQAIDHFARAARLEPTSDTTHQYLGLALAGAGRFPDAIAELREALRLNPGNQAAERALGMAMERASAPRATRK